MKADWIAIGAVIGWGGLWLQFCVRPFFAKAESLHQDYIHNGTMDLALSYIESQLIIPTLAKIFDKVHEAHQSDSQAVNTTDLLHQVDYLSDLENLEEALDAKRNLKDGFQELTHRAARLWKIALSHIIAVALGAVLYLLFDMLLTTIAIGTLATAAFFWMLYDIWRYETNQSRFLRHLQEYRIDGQQN